MDSSSYRPGVPAPDSGMRRDRYDVVQGALEAYNREYHSWRMRQTTEKRDGPVELFRVEPPPSRAPDATSELTRRNPERGPECRNEAQAEGWRCFKAMEAALASAGVALPKQVMSCSESGPEMPRARSPEDA